jgi:hypothetical protein
MSFFLSTITILIFLDSLERWVLKASIVWSSEYNAKRSIKNDHRTTSVYTPYDFIDGSHTNQGRNELGSIPHNDQPHGYCAGRNGRF